MLNHGFLPRIIVYNAENGSNYVKNFPHGATKSAVSGSKDKLVPIMVLELILRKFLFLIAVALLFSLASFAQPPAPAIGEIYLARDDGTGKAGEAASGFLTTDVPLYCVVLLNSTGPVTVRMNLVAVSVPGVKAETKVVSTVFTTRQDQNRVNFSGRPDGRWAAGKYRADIYINNEFADKLNFEIRKAASNVKTVSNLQPKRGASHKSPAKKQNR